VVAVSAVGVPGPPRLAVIAGRKVGTAVARNRAKRRLREAAARSPMREGRDYILIADPAVNEAPFAQLTAWVGEALEA
jgi:ribonuclease P protein component